MTRTYRLYRAMRGLFFVYDADGSRVGMIAGHKGEWQAQPEGGKTIAQTFPTQDAAAVALITA